MSTGQAGAEIGIGIGTTLNCNHEAPIACYPSTQETAHTLRGEGFDASEDGTGRSTPLVPVAFQPRFARNGRGGPSDVAYPLTAQAGETGKGDSAQCIAFVQNTRDEVRLMNGDGQIAGALAAEPGMKQQCYVMQHWSVRRLTTTECGRLQGFKDGYLDINHKGKPAADGPKYKAFGNSMPTNVIQWLGRRIQMVEDLSDV